MAVADYNLEAQHSPHGFADEKAAAYRKESVQEESAHEAAARGHAATDR